MEIILLYLVLVPLGYLSGMLVNFITDWFYIRRRFLPNEFVAELTTRGWFRYLALPYSIKTGEIKFKHRVLIVNLLFVILLPVLGLYAPERVELWWAYPVLLYFAIVIVMDIEFRIVMHPISIAGAILGVTVGSYLHGFDTEAFVTTLAGGIVGFVIMYLLYLLGEVFIKFINRRRGILVDEVALGFGDVNIAGVVGLFIGWPPIILGLLFAIFLGGVVSILFVIVTAVTGRFRAFAALPYAPFLAFAALVMLFFPGYIINLIGS
jgi:prepilin signal peptidase PulO-like enzyme (type II secretory pathway)